MHRILKHTWIDGLLFIMTMATIVTGRIWYQHSAYTAGRHPLVFSNQSLLSDPLILGIFFLVGIAFAFALFIRFLIRAKRSKSRTITGCLVPTIMFSVLFITPVICTKTARPWGCYFLDVFREWVCKEVDLVEIRKWAQTLNMNDPPSTRIPETKWPTIVSKLQPQDVSINNFKNIQKLNLCWGGGFMSWDLSICNINNNKDYQPEEFLGTCVLYIDKTTYICVY